MSSLANKRILLGVTGGIAAYKSANLVRRLQDAGANVRVVMTAAAQEFITPLTMQALSGNPVHTTLLDPEAEAGMGHIQLARWADLVLIAPASADFMARLVQGQGNDLLTTVCLATAAPIAIAPAMNQGMWRNASTQANVDVLSQRKVHIFGPAAGEQACGDVGPGRMLEPSALVDAAASLFVTGVLAGKKVVITAGPTQESIDPIRYITNRSSGKMGYALARAFTDVGADVILISGPVTLSSINCLQTIFVKTALEMHDAVMNVIHDADIFVGTAAVANYRVENPSTQKIKSHDDHPTLSLIKNLDIIESVSKQNPKPFIVGFAAETENLIEYATNKMKRKNMDMIIANDVSNNQGMGSEMNAVTVILKEGQMKIFDHAPKNQLAYNLVEFIANVYDEELLCENS